VVVGTGTGVGKTAVACALCRQARSAGLHVVGLKPVETGSDANGVWADAAALSVASGGVGGPDQPLFGYARPVSPHLEARRTGRTIDLAAVTAWVDEHAADVTIVETAGGLLSPLGPGQNNLDLARATGPDRLLLVGRDGLGVLHEVAACRLVLEHAELWADTCVALSAAPPHDASTGTNAPELEALGLADDVGVLGADGHAPWGRWVRRLLGDAS
jgi:dethiobiotin synthetase